MTEGKFLAGALSFGNVSQGCFISTSEGQAVTSSASHL